MIEFELFRIKDIEVNSITGAKKYNGENLDKIKLPIFPALYSEFLEKRKVKRNFTLETDDEIKKRIFTEEKTKAELDEEFKILKKRNQMIKMLCQGKIEHKGKVYIIESIDLKNNGSRVLNVR